MIYADDALVIGESAALVSEYGACIEKAAANYGMSLHWGKIQALSVGTSDRLCRLDGTVIPESGTLEYLGALLSADGRVDSELSRRIGMAADDFRSLQKLWGHANVPVAQKLRFFEALILSRLQSDLATMWLVTSQRRRLDGFLLLLLFASDPSHSSLLCFPHFDRYGLAACGGHTVLKADAHKSADAFWPRCQAPCRELASEQHIPWQHL